MALAAAPVRAGGDIGVDVSATRARLIVSLQQMGAHSVYRFLRNTCFPSFSGRFATRPPYERLMLDCVDELPTLVCVRQIFLEWDGGHGCCNDSP